MQGLALGLTIHLKQPVIDETKIEGIYELNLPFDDYDKDSQAFGSIFTAVRQAGLKLEARKLPIEMLIIDGAERPSDN